MNGTDKSRVEKGLGGYAKGDVKGDRLVIHRLQSPQHALPKQVWPIVRNLLFGVSGLALLLINYWIEQIADGLIRQYPMGGYSVILLFLLVCGGDMMGALVMISLPGWPESRSYKAATLACGGLLLAAVMFAILFISTTGLPFDVAFPIYFPCLFALFPFGATVWLLSFGALYKAAAPWKPNLRCNSCGYSGQVGDQHCRHCGAPIVSDDQAQRKLRQATQLACLLS